MNLKKVLGILTTTALALTLAACSDGDNNQDNQESKKGNQVDPNKAKGNQGEIQTKTNPDGNVKKETQKEQSVDEIVQNLTDEEKVALALYEPSVAPTSITANELLSGQYTYQPMSHMPAEIRSVSQLTLKPDSPGLILPGSPSDLTLYGIYPVRVNAVPRVAVSNDQVVVFGTQSPTTYDDIINDTSGISQVFNIKDLYNRHSNEDYKELASKIVIGEPPIPQETDTTSDTNSSSSSGTKVTRENVIDLVEDYEGHLLDTNTYTYKEPAQLDDGSWGFSFLDKAGNLAGSYIVSADGEVTKYDEDGIEE